MADAEVSKTFGQHPCGFESHLGYHESTDPLEQGGSFVIEQSAVGISAA